MPLIPLDKAAENLGVSPETIKQWAQDGLLTIHCQVIEASQEGALGLAVVQQLVDENELIGVAESLGWLQLSAEGWDVEE